MWTFKIIFKRIFKIMGAELLLMTLFNKADYKIAYSMITF